MRYKAQSQIKLGLDQQFNQSMDDKISTSINLHLQQFNQPVPQQEDHCPESEIYHLSLNFLQMHISLLSTPSNASLLLLVCLILVLKGSSQFTPETNKPVRNQQSFQQSDLLLPNDPTSTSEQVSQNTEQNPSQGTKYKRISTSQEYNTLFAEQINKISLSEVVNATVISNGKQICADLKPCHFYYYIIKPKFDAEEMSSFDFSGNNNVRNIFVVAGMHGNQYLGPTALLYAIKYLETPGTRIILFPLANPSGYDHNTRLTHPTKIDPNRDFPIEQYKQCYQCSSPLIIDHIYRKYHIDLTLALHNGRSQIGWTWGTMRQRLNSHTKDEIIYRDIGEWLKFMGGRNKKIQMDTFSIGTINEVVYPVQGGFEDWAYAASWYSASVSTAPSRNCNYLKFPFNMTNGLVFLFELGPFKVNEEQFGSEEGLNTHPTSTNSSNGYISRTIRMLSGLMKIPNPRLDIKFTKGSLITKLNGCRKGIIEQIKVTRKSDNTVLFETKKQHMQIQGSLNNKTVQPLEIKLKQELQDPSSKGQYQNLQTLMVQYELSCDPEWMGNGNTVFGKKRLFKAKQNVVLASLATKHMARTFFSSSQEAINSFGFVGQLSTESIPDKLEDFVYENSQFLTVMIIMVIVLSIIFFVIWVICRQISKDRKERKMKKLMRKLQKTNSQGPSSVGSEQEIEETTQEEIVMKSRQGTKKGSKNVQSYPEMCQSDKAMKNQNIEQGLQL